MSPCDTAFILLYLWSAMSGHRAKSSRRPPLIWVTHIKQPSYLLSLSRTPQPSSELLLSEPVGPSPLTSSQRGMGVFDPTRRARLNGSRDTMTSRRSDKHRQRKGNTTTSIDNMRCVSRRGLFAVLCLLAASSDVTL